MGIGRCESLHRERRHRPCGIPCNSRNKGLRPGQFRTADSSVPFAARQAAKQATEIKLSVRRRMQCRDERHHQIPSTFWPSPSSPRGRIHARRGACNSRHREEITGTLLCYCRDRYAATQIFVSKGRCRNGSNFLTLRHSRAMLPARQALQLLDIFLRTDRHG